MSRIKTKDGIEIQRLGQRSAHCLQSRRLEETPTVLGANDEPQCRTNSRSAFMNQQCQLAERWEWSFEKQEQ
jgi:hypothetical protein